MSRIITKVTIKAPDQVHAFLHLWNQSKEARGLELLDIQQDAAGLLHKFTLAEAVAAAESVVPEYGLKEIPLTPVKQPEAVKVDALLPKTSKITQNPTPPKERGAFDV